MSKDDGGAVKRSWLERSMGAVEKVGNLLPHPFWLFASLALVTVVLSAVPSRFAIRSRSAARSRSTARPIYSSTGAIRVRI